MSIKAIPASTETTCDVYKRVCGKEATAKQKTQLHIKRNALDYLGDPAADGSTIWDLCDDCTNMIVTAINTTINTLIDKQRERMQQKGKDK